MQDNTLDGFTIWSGKLTSTSHVRKILIAVFILVVVTVAGVVTYLAYRPLDESYVVSPVSSGITSSETQSTANTQTISSSTTTTTALPIQWITVGQAKSVDY